MKKFNKKYQEIITVPNLLLAWKEFQRGKQKRNDVIIFQNRLMDNIFNLYQDLKNKTYRHSAYSAFNISDPKPRNIHKATVRDRLLHHLLYLETYHYFDRRFISDSYSCRVNKGTHLANQKLVVFIRQVSLNNKRTVWALKCDIQKFFASIDHQILKNILNKYIVDQDLIWLFNRVIDSFNTLGKIGIGLPLGNLTSQLLVNVYLNEFDQFIKHDLKIKYYIRYADDFIFLSTNKNKLTNLRLLIEKFLKVNLQLKLHPQKVFLKTVAVGVDFLGWVHFYDYQILRTNTKKRMFKRIILYPTLEMITAYQGLLKQGNTYKLRQEITKNYNIF